MQETLHVVICIEEKEDVKQILPYNDKKYFNYCSRE